MEQDGLVGWLVGVTFTYFTLLYDTVKLQVSKLTLIKPIAAVALYSTGIRQRFAKHVPSRRGKKCHSFAITNS